jgi:osmotically-inducible protein OsmY
VSARDVAVADSVAQLFKSNTSLSDATRNVEATVDGGVVTLRGSVPSDHDRDELVMRVGRLPGVVRVHDQLGVDVR